VRDRIVSSDWRQMLPVLHGAGFHLRELRRSDAASLFSMLTTEEVGAVRLSESLEGWEGITGGRVH